MPAAISTSGLGKDYGSGRGLFDLHLEVPESVVFGYLGPNGAGKTTTIRLLMGDDPPELRVGLDLRPRLSAAGGGGQEAGRLRPW